MKAREVSSLSHASGRPEVRRIPALPRLRIHWPEESAPAGWSRNEPVGHAENDKAEAYARELLDLAEASARDWNYGNAVHDGHRILGQLALQRGDGRSAKEHLLAAGETPGSPQLDSFGPELTLANDLLAAGERATVVAYLKACERFWKTRGDDLRTWIAAIEAGETPVLDRSFWARPRRGSPQP